LKSADGTDDAQIIVTVVDADGKALSNSPPVTLDH
jgi:beta-galactosidase